VIDADQLRAARGLLNISQADLAKSASVHVATIRRLEGATEIRGAAESLWKIETALEQAGVEFLQADDTKGPGVRLKHSQHGESQRKGRRGRG